MATIGQVLATAETGWSRCNDNHTKLVYTGSTWTRSLTNFMWADGNLATIQFKFKGTKLRILSYSTDSTRSNNIQISIDGIIESFSENLPQTGNEVLVYEKINLNDTYHDVIITNGDLRIDFSAIDIDTAGFLSTVLGQRLSSPEFGWRRYDDTDSRIQSSSGWTTNNNASWYLSYAKQSLIIGSTILFKFHGTKLRIISSYHTSGGKMSISIDNSPPKIVSLLNDTILFQNIVFDTITLSNDNHTVSITHYSAGYTFFDAIDIDDNGYLMHPILNQVLTTDSILIGDCIPCRYTALTSGAAGFFSELGTCIANEIPVTGTATPDGLFYLTKNDKGMLIADRVVQTGISWDALNTAKFIEGIANPVKFAPMDGGGTNGLNILTSKTANYESSIEYNGELYVSWCEDGTGTQLRVKKFNGTVWSIVDGGSGLNYTVGTSVYTYLTSMEVYNGCLYCAWRETNNGTDSIRVKKWDGISWVFVDVSTIYGLKYNSGKGASSPYLKVFNGELYCAWEEASVSGNFGQILVRKYNGTDWSWASYSLNYSVSQSADNPNLSVYNNELYCTWRETYVYSVYQIRVKKWNGTTWSWVDGGSSNGMNYDSSKSSSSCWLTESLGELYLIWSEMISTTVAQIRIKKWNGTTWTWVGSEGIGSSLSLSSNSSYYGGNSTMFSLNNKLYCTWSETIGNIVQIRVRVWDGVLWTWLDGGGTIGINNKSTQSGNTPILTSFKNDLFCVWVEGNPTYGQIRASKLVQINGLIRSLSGGNSYVDYSNKRIVSTLLHGDGADGSTSFIDSSPNPKVWTKNGSAMIKTDQSKFGGSSMYFNGSTDWIDTPTNVDFNFSTDDFIIDFWLKRGRVGVTERFLGQGDVSNTSSFGFIFNANNTIIFRNSVIDITSTNTINETNAWHHIVGSRIGTNVYLYVDGIQWATGVVGSSSLSSSSYKLAIGRFGEFTSQYFQGYIDEFRITKGKAEYTAPFTPPTAPYSEPTNTLMEAFSSTVDKGLGAYPEINEWDKYIANSNLGGKIVKGDDGVWHYGTSTWCKETPILSMSTNTTRIRRGINFTNRMDVNVLTTTVASLIGFRPVLEYLEPTAKATNLFY